MTNLMQANAQWSSRPNDERYLSLLDMQADMQAIQDASTDRVVLTKQIEVVPDGSNLSIAKGSFKAPVSNWAFSQLAGIAGAPAGYLRKLPVEMAADCVNYGLRFGDSAPETKLLFTNTDNGYNVRAATGAGYGRIMNASIVDKLVSKFGDGVNGEWRVPGEFGRAVPVTKQNTTLYAGDRDMFVFLCNEENRIIVPNRRNGEDGSMARGFFVWNSEVGSATLGIATFLFDYVCSNRIVWGATEYREIKIRHTKNAHRNWMYDVAPMLSRYGNAASANEQQAIINAQQAKLGKHDDVQEFLSKRFTNSIAKRAIDAHMLEEHRPIETMWDAVVGLTASAKSINYQDERVNLEREAGKLLTLVK
jgi:hypothetical protein